MRLVSKLLFLSFFLSLPVFASPSIEAGKAKSATCIACHSEDGNSVVPAWPKIAGQHEKYLAKQLHDYQKGEDGPRYDPQMYGMVVTLTEEDIADLAAYYASQKLSPGSTKQEYLDLGERIYRGGNVNSGVTACIACHGPKGGGNFLANYPRLGGQHAEYTATQLRYFKEGQRANDPNEMMRNIASRMTEEEIVAVSEYIAGVK